MEMPYNIDHEFPSRVRVGGTKSRSKKAADEPYNITKISPNFFDEIDALALA
jgi:hypothetical protein